LGIKTAINPMKIVIPGGTGQVGRVLVRALRAHGHEIVVLSRGGASDVRVVMWDGRTVGPWAGELDGADMVINLAGRSVNCRYTNANQSSLAGELLQRYGRKSDDRDTVYVVANYGGPNECLFAKARAVLFVLGAIAGIWGLTRIFDVLPSPFLDGLYDFVALRRYRWFGHSDTCIAPQPEHRSKFLDDRRSPTA
jgi:predicted DCC family thiol-disulfide oxidoreductase YuxK